MPETLVEPLRFTLRLPAHPVSAAAARNLVRVLQRWVPVRKLDVVELVVSEIVTNAVRHGSPSAADVVELELTATATEVSGCVSDRGRAFVLSGDAPRIDRTGGFGLHIARELASSLAVEHGPGGNVVRFTVLTA
jgi:anti-sigma regulatory factor (Ser/Thr protein kinase)